MFDPYIQVYSEISIIDHNLLLFFIRYNLDPACEIADNKIWTALESVQLKDMIEALPDQLGRSMFNPLETLPSGFCPEFCT